MNRTLNMSRAIWAGLIAGIVFMMVEMILVGTVGGGSPWAPPRMIAAMAMGKDVLPPPASFDIVILMVAMMIHFVMSIIFGIVFAWVADRMAWSRTTTIVAGMVFGLILYIVNFYGMTAVFPWFAMARNWISILAHVVFGGVLGWYYAAGYAHRVVADRV